MKFFSSFQLPCGQFAGSSGSGTSPARGIPMLVHSSPQHSLSNPLVSTSLVSCFRCLSAVFQTCAPVVCSLATVNHQSRRLFSRVSVPLNIHFCFILVCFYQSLTWLRASGHFFFCFDFNGMSRKWRMAVY